MKSGAAESYSGQMPRMPPPGTAPGTPSSICGNCKITLTFNTNAQLASWKKQLAKRRIEHYSQV